MSIALRIAAGFCLFTMLAAAQVDRSELNGSVTDASGAAVPGVSVKVKESSTGLERETTTGGSGTYSLSALPAGEYRIEFFKQGFGESKFENVRQAASQTRTLNVRLQLEQVAQTLEVSAPAEVDASNATQGGNVEQQQIHEIPLNGRNWSTLIELVPGAVDTGGGNAKTIRFNGQGNDDTNYRLDGNDFSGIQNQAPKSLLRLQISTEAIQEFTVDTATYTADNGGSAGAQINAVSKSGTNNFNGSLFEYLRNNDFDARSPFNPTSQPQPPFHLNQFGADLGGPIVKDKTFFFLSYEGFQQVLGLTQVGFVPTEAFRAQVAATQPGLASIINAFPVGNGAFSATAPTIAQRWSGAVSSPVTENSGLIRVDHRFNDNNTAYFRYNIDVGSSTSPLGGLNESQTVPATLQNGIIEYLHIFSPTLLNEIRVGFDRNYYSQYYNSSLPRNYVIPDFSELYETYNKVQASTSFDERDDVTKTAGNHTLKFGVEVRRVQINEGNSNDSTVTWGPGINNFLNNQLTNFTNTAVLPTKGLRKTQYFGYAQDEWKIKPNFTVTAGVRYNFFGPFYEVNSRAYPFDVNSCPPPGYCARGAEFTFPNYLDFDPRLSFAWSPASAHSHTVIRGGYGMFHGEDQLGDQDSPVVNDEPSISLISNANTTYSYPVPASLITLTGLAATPRSMARHHPDSYSQQWSLSIQQLLPGRFSLTTTYLGEKGTDLFQRSYTNLINPATRVAYLAAYGIPTEVDTKLQTGNSSFNSLQAALKRTFQHGFFFDANYTWSHEIDDGSVGAGDSDAAEDINYVRGSRASGDYDVRSAGNISLTYLVPFGHGHALFNSKTADLFLGGWEVTDLYTARTGLPINITVSRSGGSLPDGNNVNQRPNYVEGQNIYAANPNPSDWLNLAAFSVPAAGTWGNLGRNIARGPGLWQDDIALDKNFALTERFTLNFRAEAFNIFNRPQYANPSNVNISSPATFGVITSLVNSTGLTGTGTPRQLQFALRLSF